MSIAPCYRPSSQELYKTTRKEANNHSNSFEELPLPPFQNNSEPVRA